MTIEEYTTVYGVSPLAQSWRCSKCKKPTLGGDFRLLSRSSNGLRSQCRMCEQESGSERYQYRKANGQEAAARARKCSTPEAKTKRRLRGQATYYKNWEQNREKRLGKVRLDAPMSIDRGILIENYNIVADPRAVDPAAETVKRIEIEPLLSWMSTLPDHQRAVVEHFMEALETVPVEEASGEAARLLGLTEARVDEVMRQVRQAAGAVFGQ